MILAQCAMILAQVRKNGNDLHHSKYANNRLPTIYKKALAQVPDKKSHLRHGSQVQNKKSANTCSIEERQTTDY